MRYSHPPWSGFYFFNPSFYFFWNRPCWHINNRHLSSDESLFKCEIGLEMMKCDQSEHRGSTVFSKKKVKLRPRRHSSTTVSKCHQEPFGRHQDVKLISIRSAESTLWLCELKAKPIVIRPRPCSAHCHVLRLQKNPSPKKLAKWTLALWVNFWANSFFFFLKKKKIEVKVKKKDPKKIKESANTGSN